MHGIFAYNSFVPKKRTQVLFDGVRPICGGVSTNYKIKYLFSDLCTFMRAIRTFAGQYGQYRICAQTKFDSFFSIFIFMKIAAKIYKPIRFFECVIMHISFHTDSNVSIAYFSFFVT